jgi:integrase
MKATLTNALIAKLKPEPKPYEVYDEKLQGLFVRVQPSGHKGFYCTWKRNARKVLGPCSALTVDRARVLAKEVLAQHFMGTDPREADREAKRAITFAEFIEKHYAPWAAANNRTGKDAMKRFAQAFPDLLDKPLLMICALDAERWRINAAKRGLKVTSINRHLAMLRGALSRAVEWEWLEANPLNGVKQGKTDSAPKVRYLSDDELARLHAALDAREERLRAARDRANAWRTERGHPLLPDLREQAYADHLKPMVLLSLHTGMRRGELFALTWDCVNLSGSMLTVRGSDAKSGKTRHIDLNPDAVAILSGWRPSLEASGLIFPAEDGGRFDNVRKAWAGALDEAGITNFRWHDMRHHFASALVMSGSDLVTVRELMGHSDFALTLRYAHLAPSHRAAAVAKLSGIGR